MDRLQSNWNQSALVSINERRTEVSEKEFERKLEHHIEWDHSISLPYYCGGQRFPIRDVIYLILDHLNVELEIKPQETRLKKRNNENK